MSLLNIYIKWRTKVRSIENAMERWISMFDPEEQPLYAIIFNIVSGNRFVSSLFRLLSVCQHVQTDNPSQRIRFLFYKSIFSFPVLLKAYWSDVAVENGISVESVYCLVPSPLLDFPCFYISVVKRQRR